MPQDPSRITYLLQRYTSKTCTREELEELFVLIADASNDPELQASLDAAYASLPADAPLPDIDMEEVYRRIAPVQKRRFYLRYAAAAAVLLAIAATFLLWPGQQDTTTPTVITQLKNNTPILPAANKAVLTLADGTTYTLDSAGNQQIGSDAQQRNGQLEYHAANSAAVQFHKLATPRGGQFHFTLPDGTKVWLNSASSLRYPTAFHGKNRTVELEGQGYFEVAQKADMPFLVKVNDMEVQVLGTRFDVMAYKDESSVNTTLVDGSVRVKQGNATQLLKPGEQAQLRDQTFSVQEADVQKVLAWKNGLFVFNNMDIRTILREVARWYDVEIEYSTQPNEEQYGGGISRNLPLAHVLKLLEAGGYNHFKIEGRKVIVLP